MTYQEIIDSRMADFQAAHERFQSECAKLRSGRASTTLIDDLSIDYYGTPTPLKQAANVTVPEARQILIQPWDKGILELIEDTIKKSGLGLQTSNDGVVIRIALPPMTEENRKDLVKVLNQRTEEARVAVRGVREEVWKDIQNQQKDGDMSEDDKFAGKDALQKVVDQNNARIEEVRQKKEADILTV
jgi:ribosome recycling factor